MKTILFFLSVVVASTVTYAQRASDIDGANDYPLVSRFEGSVIEYYKATKWDDYKLPVSKNQVNRMEFKKPIALEGRVMRWQYSVSPDNNPAYVLKNYEKAFKQNGYKILLEGKPDDGLENSNDFYDRFYGDWENSKLERFGFAYEPIGNHKAIIVAKTNNQEKDIYIIEVISDFSNTTMITQDIIEVEAADTGMVTAKNMDEDIASTGHIAIYDILFDAGKAAIKPKSAMALQNIADYLNANPSKRYYVVGHTDNTGEFEANMSLSKNRAKAVMDYLVNKLGVANSQLNAHGAGSLSPIASNNTLEGKTKNRRVEIVEQ